jgi:hypothetical protein
LNTSNAAQKFKYKHTLVFRTRRLVQTIIDATPQLLIPWGDAVNYFYRPQPLPTQERLFYLPGAQDRLAFTAAAADKNGRPLKMPSRLSARRSGK